MQHQFRRIVCSGCGESLDVPVYCGDRFCPVCSVTRSIRVKRRLTWLVDQQSKLPNQSFFFWTFSLKNCTDLTKGIKQLQLAFRRLRNRAYWKNHVTGGGFVIEIKGHPGNWHPHIHAILYSNWMKWDTVFTLWRKCSGGRGCYVKLIPKSAAVAYVTKYLSKPDVPDQVAIEISAALKGIRLFAPIGAWHAGNKSYPKKATPCKRCGSSHWMDWDVASGNFPQPHFKDFDLRPKPLPFSAP